MKASDVHSLIFHWQLVRELRLSCLAALVGGKLCFILMKSVQIWKADRDQVFYLILCFVLITASLWLVRATYQIFMQQAPWFDLIHGVEEGPGHLSLWKAIKNAFIIEDVTLTCLRSCPLVPKCPIYTHKPVRNRSMLSSIHLSVSEVKRSGAKGDGGAMVVGNTSQKNGEWGKNETSGRVEKWAFVVMASDN